LLVFEASYLDLQMFWTESNWYYADDIRFSLKIFVKRRTIFLENMWKGTVYQNGGYTKPIFFLLIL